MLDTEHACGYDMLVKGPFRIVSIYPSSYRFPKLGSFITHSACRIGKLHVSEAANETLL